MNGENRQRDRVKNSIILCAQKLLVFLPYDVTIIQMLNEEGDDVVVVVVVVVVDTY